MNWNVAQAKQRLSEIIREAAHEPQMIYSRNRPVAALIAADDLARFETWKSEQASPQRRTLAEEFAELRQLMIEAGFEDGLEIPPRVDRPNAFVKMLEEEYPELQP
jgi:prevent-host-death family protein